MQWLADETHIKEECGPYVTRQSKKSALLFLLLSHVQTQSIPSRIGQHFCTCTHGLEWERLSETIWRSMTSINSASTSADSLASS